MADLALAVDIGGTKLAAALVAADGTVARRGIVSTAASCDPSRVVIGGGVAAAHDVLFPPLRAAITEHARLAFLRNLTVATASLGSAAGLVGAAALVLAPEAYAGRGVASLA